MFAEYGKEDIKEMRTVNKKAELTGEVTMEVRLPKGVWKHGKTVIIMGFDLTIIKSC